MSDTRAVDIDFPFETSAPDWTVLDTFDAEEDAHYQAGSTGVEHRTDKISEALVGAPTMRSIRKMDNLVAYPMFHDNSLVLLDLRASVREVCVSWRAPHMEAKTQEQPITAPEIAPQGESVESTSKRGGKRPGAGRKPDLVKRMISQISPATARDVLGTVDVEKVIKEIFQKGSLTLKQRTLADLWDRSYGRPAQALNVSGTVGHVHWTPGKYSHLTDEEFAKLAELTAKALGQPASNTAQNAPQNQIESKPAIEAEVVASGVPRIF